MHVLFVLSPRNRWKIGRAVWTYGRSSRVQTSRLPGWFGTRQIRSPRRQRGPGRKKSITFCFIASWEYLELTISSGLTGYLSSDFEVFTTFPLLVTFLAFFSLAFLICGVLGILERRVVLVSVGVSFLDNKDLLADVFFSSSSVGLVAGRSANTTNSAQSAAEY